MIEQLDAQAAASVARIVREVRESLQRKYHDVRQAADEAAPPRRKRKRRPAGEETEVSVLGGK